VSLLTQGFFCFAACFGGIVIPRDAHLPANREPALSQKRTGPQKRKGRPVGGPSRIVNRRSWQ